MFKIIYFVIIWSKGCLNYWFLNFFDCNISIKDLMYIVGINFYFYCV